MEIPRVLTKPFRNEAWSVFSQDWSATNYYNNSPAIDPSMIIMIFISTLLRIVNYFDWQFPSPVLLDFIALYVIIIIIANYVISVNKLLHSAWIQSSLLTLFWILDFIFKFSLSIIFMVNYQLGIEEEFFLILIIFSNFF